jgi:hypothetical protein
MRIENKSQLKANIDNITLKRTFNFNTDNKVKVGSIGKVVYKQTNAFKVKYNTLENALCVYYDSIEVKDNKMLYYAYITDYDTERVDFESKIKKNNIELIELTDKEKEKMNKENNYNYVYKYVVIINELEVK